MTKSRFLLSVGTAALLTLAPHTVFASPQGVLFIAENETPENLDPANATNSTVDQLILGVYDTLVQFKAGDTSPTASLATGWEISEDGKTYTFTIADGATFHDGSPVEASDVVFTLDRLKAANSGVLNNMAPFTHAEAIDAKTVELHLDAPFGPFLGALSRVYIVSEDLVAPHMANDNARQWLAVNTAGSGPYDITEYTPTEAVVLEAQENYWGGWEGNHVQTVVFRYVTEPSTQLALLQRGEVHIAPDVALEDKLALDGTPGYVIDVGPAATPLMFAINTANGITANPDFRRMLAMSFDRQLHLDTVLMGYGTLPSSPIPPDWLGAIDGTEQQYDLEGARALVEANGWAGTEILVRYLPAIMEEQKAVEQLQSNLAQIGITLHAEGMTWPAQAATTASAETSAELNVIYNFPNFPDPHAILSTSFNGAYTGAKGGLNWAQLENAELDAILNTAAASSDPEERAALYAQAQTLIGEIVPTITVSLPGSVVALSDSVEGYVYNVAHHQTFNYPDIGLK